MVIPKHRFLLGYLLFRNNKIAIRLYFGQFKIEKFQNFKSERPRVVCNLDLWIVVKFETSENWISRSRLNLVS